MRPSLSTLALLASASLTLAQAHDDYETVGLTARGRDDPASIDIDLYARDAEADAEAEAFEDPASIPIGLYARDAEPDAESDPEFDSDLSARDIDDLLASLESRGILTDSANQLLDSLGEDGEKAREYAKDWLPSLELRDLELEERGAELEERELEEREAEADCGCD